MLPAMLYDLFRSRFHSLLQRNGGVHGLTPDIVRYAKDRCFRDCGVPVKDILHFSWIDIEPSTDDHVILSIHNENIALLIPVAHISGA
jgi:hypothetical protein